MPGAEPVQAIKILEGRLLKLDVYAYYDHKVLPTFNVSNARPRRKGRWRPGD